MGNTPYFDASEGHLADAAGDILMMLVETNIEGIDIDLAETPAKMTVTFTGHSCDLDELACRLYHAERVIKEDYAEYLDKTSCDCEE